MQEHYTAQEAANRLKVCATTIYRMVKRGELTATKEKGRLLIPVSEVERLSMGPESSGNVPQIDDRSIISPFIASPADTGDIIKGEMSVIPDTHQTSVQAKVRFSLKFLRWLLLINRTVSRALEAAITFLESDGKAS
jgi:excisionase family DNA binding protein